ncbi:MAG: SurA N-terminal domain-containing protein [Thermodesulfobacteriota bacterium]
MLDLMRKHAGSWMIKILLGAIALAFALSWGVSQYGQDRRPPAVKINGEAIAESRVSEVYANLVEEAKQQLGAQFERVAPMLNLRQRALEVMVNQVLLSQAADQMGVVVSDLEVQERLAAMPVFQQGGRFDVQLYRRILARSRLTPEQFEASQRQELRMAKLSALVAGTAQVTPLELDLALSQTLAKVKGVYVVFKPAAYTKDVKPTDQEIEKYYQANKAQYLNPATLRFDYIVFPLAEQRDQTKVTDQEVREAYEAGRQRYSQPESVAARHILFKLPENPSPAEVKAAKEKAEKVLALAKRPKADFAKLAKQYSQGPTKDRGGDLGRFARGQMLPSFEKLAFSLPVGGVGLVQTRFGWHVVKVYEHNQASVTPLDKVKDDIRASLTRRRERELAQAAAERTFDKLALSGKLKELAQQLKKTVTSSPRVSQGQKVEGLPGLQDIFAAAQDLKPGQPVPALGFDGGSILAVVTERVEEKAKPLAQVRDKVRKAVAERLAQDKAKAEAAKLLKDLAATKDPAAEMARLPQAVRTGWLGSEDQVKDLPGSSQMVHALLLQPLKRPVLPAPLEVGDGFVAAVLAGRQEAPAKEIEAKRAGFQEQLLAAQRRQVLQSFMEDLRARAQVLVPVQGAPGKSFIPGCDSPGSLDWVPLDSPRAQAHLRTQR